MTWFLLALGAVAVYVVLCCAWPFANCLRCRGSGKARSPWGGSWRRCRRCKGSGERVRVGRRAWTWWTDVYSKGSRR